jgi:hypothetical protein
MVICLRETVIFHFSWVISLNSFRVASCYFVDRLPGRGMRTIHETTRIRTNRRFNKAESQMENEKWKMENETFLHLRTLFDACPYLRLAS